MISTVVFLVSLARLKPEYTGLSDADEVVCRSYHDSEQLAGAECIAATISMCTCALSDLVLSLSAHHDGHLKLPKPRCYT